MGERIFLILQYVLYLLILNTKQFHEFICFLLYEFSFVDAEIHQKNSNIYSQNSRKAFGDNIVETESPCGYTEV